MALTLERMLFESIIINDNIKITVPEDLALARFYLRAQEEEGLAWQFV